MKTLFLLLAGLLLSSQSMAALPSAAEVEFQLNRGTESMRRVQLGTLITKKKVQVMKATYRYSVQGGSSSAAIDLLDTDGKAAKLPDNAIIKQVLFDVLTAPTSDQSATLAFSAQSAGDLKAALGKASWSGLVAGIPVGTAATMIKLTAERTLQLQVAVGPLTDGSINVFVEYYLSD